MTDEELAAVGLSAAQASSIRSGGRPDIPQAHVAQVLWSNRFMCCVCRDPSLAFILHHIIPWAESRDHSPSNLAVLCLEHHARAHRTGALEQNLGRTELRSAKERWEAEVRLLDVSAIMRAARAPGSHWWWFNHLRVFELADALGVELAQVEGFAAAAIAGTVDQDGYPGTGSDDDCYRYEGGAGMALYRYVRGVLDASLSQTSVFNISNDLDAGFLSQVVNSGDLIVLQGRHHFRRLNGNDRGPGQACRGVRQANGVQIRFTIDLWEATSNSAWSTWISGTTNATSLLRVGQVARADGRLVLDCTAIAVGGLVETLHTRSYSNPTWPRGEDGEEPIDDAAFS